MNKAIFLDRDGTIIIDRGYLCNPNDIEFISGVPELLIMLKKLGYLLVIVSNQSGVARGYFSEESVKQVNSIIQKRLHYEYGVDIDGIYYCPHHPEYGNGTYRKDCNCRKPKPGMILKAVDDLHIDMSESVMVGDKESDHILIEGLKFIKVEKDTNWSQNRELHEILMKEK